jgi:signal transduction histidine kinase/DNA-binding response OmpR family regulator
VNGYLTLLHDLAASTANARNWREACERSADALSSNVRDLPFAMIYIAEADGPGLFLAGASGIERDHPAAPARVDPDQSGLWPFAAVLKTHDVLMIEDLQISDRNVPLPAGAWQEEPARAVLVPIAATGQTSRGGVLVVGLNPYRLFDDGYRNFLTLVAGQISASIASAQAYQEERRRAEMLAELDRAKTVFFSNVSHELRTPLTLILGPIENMLDDSYGELTAVGKNQLQIVHRNSLRLLKLVNTMLDFSRIEAGRLQASFEAVDLAVYTAELASVFRAAVEQAGLRLIVTCPPLPEPVYVDRDLWEKIVLNLLSNAFKFTLTGEIEVRLEVVDDQAQLTVRDTGVGIPAPEMPRIFERFHRVKDARGRTHEGTGIGLALVQELVKLHGGSVHAECVLNQGSRLIVRVPLGSAHLDPQRIHTRSELIPAMPAGEAFVHEAHRWLPNLKQDPDQNIEQRMWTKTGQVSPGSAAVDSADQQPQGQRTRIVWADDNADMREYVSRLLGERFEVEAVADGQAALEAVRSGPPDLVLADVMMPRLDGFGLLQALRADPQLREIPIILLSARAGEEARIEGMEAGADDYLIKPFSARELLARVEAHVRMTRIRREAEAALQENAQRLRLAQRAGRVGIFEWQIPQNRVIWSAELERLYGLAEGSFEGTFDAWSRRVVAEDAERVAQGVDTCLWERCTDYTYEFRISDRSKLTPR